VLVNLGSLAVVGKVFADGAMVENLKALKVADGVIEITVRTGGCTEKDHFRTETVSTSGVNEITFFRTTPDKCKGFFPNGKMISFTLEDLHMDAADSSVVITNSISLSRRD